MRRPLTMLLIAIFAVPLGVFAQELPEKGALKIESPTAEVMIRSGKTVYTLKPSSQTELAPGGYMPVAVRIFKAEKIEEGSAKKAPVWVLGGKAPWGKLGRLTIEAGKTVTVSPGEPVALKVNSVTKGQDVSFGFDLIGNAGENYSPVIYRDAEELPAPKIKILDEAGKVLTSGSFSYG